VAGVAAKDTPKRIPLVYDESTVDRGENKLVVKIKTLTPLYTGGIDGTMDRIHETGIIGSLRWWYEAIVRGLGGSACDPTEHTCHFDSDKYRRSKAKDERQRLLDAGLCDVCQVFGATGWRRRFRLEVEDETQPLWTPPDKLLNIRPPDRKRGWYLPPGRMGKLTLHFIGEPSALSLIANLLLFLEKWGNLGAKPQLGYGVFSIENRNEVKGWSNKQQWRVMENKEPSDKLPDLRRFGFFKYRFAPSQPGWWTDVPGLTSVARHVELLVSRYLIVPANPALKNEWRFRRWNRTWGDPREVFGTLKPERKRSRIAVSWAYRMNGEWEVRGWAWLKETHWTKGVWSVLSDKHIWRSIFPDGELSAFQAQNSNILEIMQKGGQRWIEDIRPQLLLFSTKQVKGSFIQGRSESPLQGDRSLILYMIADQRTEK